MDLIASAERLPAAGESVTGGSFVMGPGGKGGNQAIQLSLAGCETFLVTKVGRDLFGRELVAAISAKNVNTEHIVVDAFAATGASTVFNADGDYCSIIAPGAAAGLLPSEVDAAFEAIGSCVALVVQLELPVDIALHAARRAESRGWQVVLNASPFPAEPHPTTNELFGLVDLLVLNRVEASGLCGMAVTDERTAELALRSILELTGANEVVITLGAAGAIAGDAEQTFNHPAWGVEVIDTVGAGDAFLGVYAAERLRGLSIESALARSTAAGAIATTRRGATESLPGSEEITRFIGIHRDRGGSTCRAIAGE